MIFFITFIEFLLGSLFHFLYDWFPYAWVALIAPTSESIFEHLKLVLYPMLLVSFLYIYRHQLMNKKSYSTIVVSVIVGIGSVLLIYYFYRYGLGIENTWVDIALLFVAQLLGNYAGVVVYKHDYVFLSPVIILVFLILLFTVLTFFPPQLPMFID